MGVLTNDYFCFSLLISLLMAKVIPAGDTTFQFFLVRYSSQIPFIITTYAKNKFLGVRSGSLTAAH